MKNSTIHRTRKDVTARMKLKAKRVVAPRRTKTGENKKINKASLQEGIKIECYNSINV
jgi:hypothetical protein